jgi:CheY-like chemotaxis protein
VSVQRREKLGLETVEFAVLEKIAKEQDCDLHVAPSDSKGLSFALSIPSASKTASAPVNFEPAAKGAPKRRIAARVLVLDDEEALADMMGEMLTIYGAQTEVVNDSRAALKLIEHNDFDVILSDFCMPNINGREFYEAVCATRPEMANKIIYLTGDVLNEDTRRFLHDCGRPFLLKPFDFEEVQHAISGLLHRRRSPSDAGDGSCITTSA